MRLLLVEDEKRLASALAQIFRKHNYSVDVAYDGVAGQEMAETQTYDLIILDWMLPKKDGVSVLKYLREVEIATPVLLLTAKDSKEDKVYGLDAGADDYVVKPFEPEELLARIRALNRRNSEQYISNKLVFNTVTLNPSLCEVTSPLLNLRLTPKESQLFELFMRNPGQVLTRDTIFDRIWGLECDVELNVVDTYIHYLRKKLESLKSYLYIETFRGVGYLLRETENVSQT